MRLLHLRQNRVLAHPRVSFLKCWFCARHFQCPLAGARLQHKGLLSQSWALLIWGCSQPDWTMCDPQPPWLAASLLTFSWCPCRIWRKGRRPGLAHACHPSRKGHLRPPSIWIPESDVSETGKHGDRVSTHQFTSNGLPAHVSTNISAAAGAEEGLA